MGSENCGCGGLIDKMYQVTMILEKQMVTRLMPSVIEKQARGPVTTWKWRKRRSRLTKDKEYDVVKDTTWDQFCREGREKYRVHEVYVMRPRAPFYNSSSR